MTQPFRPTQPALASSYVERSRLYHRLEHWRSLRAVVVRAPAGYGKTTLVRNWLASAKPTAVWLSLDERFDQADALIRQLALALDALVPGVFAAVQTLLDDGHPERALERLLLQVEGYGPSPAHSADNHLLLVLDDLHLVKTAAANAVVKSLVGRGPANLHMILISRESVDIAFARQYAAEQLVEIDVEMLRFSTDELHRFLAIRGYAAISDIELAQVERRTAGWILALQLAVLSQRTPGDVGSLIANLSSDSRWLSTYLAEEVLRQQSEPIQRLLLTTSILDSFNAALCEHVSGLSDAQQLVLYLQENALFVVGMVGRDEWFSYHHLFREWLERRLIDKQGHERVRTLHRRAADWYDGAGDLQLAVRHLRAAGDERAIIDLLAARLPALIMHEPFQVRRWLNQLTPQQLADPRLALLRCRLEALFDNRDLLTFVRQAEQALDASTLPEGEQRALRAELLIWRGGGHFLQGDIRSTMTVLQQSRAEPSNLDVFLSGLREFLMMHLCSYEGRQAEAAHYAEQAVVALTQADFPAIITSVRREQAKHLMWFGQSAEANRQFVLVFEQPLDRPFMLREILLTYIQAIPNSYWQDRRAEVSHYYQQAMQLAQRLQDEELLSTLVGLGALYVQNNIQAGNAEQIVDVPTILGSINIRLRIQIDLLVRAGRTEEAWRMAKNLGIGLDSDPASVNSGSLLAFIRAYIARGVNLTALTPLISRAITQRQRVSARFDELQLLTLRAWKQLKLGRRRPAIEFLEAAVQLALETGYLRVVLDIPDLLPLLELGGDRPIRVRADADEKDPASIDVITVQEQAVLKLLAQDYRYEQIAHDLRISINTVRTHVRNMYSKLGVSRRAQALVRAHELGLLK